MNLTVEPPNAYTVNVVGRMWQWSFGYPNGHDDPELHCVVNQPVRCVLESTDVIHSLYVPAFRVKKDVVPGRYNRLWFQATSANGGVYVTNVVIDGKPTRVAVDATGRQLTERAEETPSQPLIQFSKISTPVQSVLMGLLGGEKIPQDREFRTYKLANGTDIVVGGESGQPNESFVDPSGKTVGTVSEFAALPSEVQAGIKAAAKGGSVSASQPVHVFLDAEPFDIFCAGYCGTNHSTMHSRVIVHRNQADFDAWLAKASDDSDKPPLEIGKKRYVSLGCAQCHSIDGSKITGPSWKDLFGSTQQFTDGTSAVVDEAFVHNFVSNPTAKVPVGFQPVMPPFILKAKDIDGIIAFMKTISINYHGSLGPEVGKAATQPAGAPATQPTTAPAQ
jgi:cytochrome c2